MTASRFDGTKHDSDLRARIGEAMTTQAVINAQVLVILQALSRGEPVSLSPQLEALADLLQSNTNNLMNIMALAAGYSSHD